MHSSSADLLQLMLKVMRFHFSSKIGMDCGGTDLLGSIHIWVAWGAGPRLQKQILILVRRPNNYTSENPLLSRYREGPGKFELVRNPLYDPNP